MILIVKHVEIEGPGTLGEFFENTAREVKTIELEKGDRLPKDSSHLEALVVLGGPMGVYDEQQYAFLEDEVRLLAEAVQRGVPTLGICLGAQLLAKAFGSRVEKAPHKEVGWFKVDLTKEAEQDPLFKGQDKQIDVFQWHEDSFEVPKNGVLLASGELCRKQAFKVGDCGWGLQFHPEMSGRMLAEWLAYYSEDINKERMMHDFIAKKHSYSRQALALYLNFARVIDKYRKSNSEISGSSRIFC